MSIDVPSAMKAAVIVAINGYKLNNNIFGGEQDFDNFFDRFEVDTSLRKSLGEDVIKNVRLIVRVFIDNYNIWIKVFAVRCDEKAATHLFAALSMNSLSLGQLSITASARPSDVLCDYLSVAVDDGVTYDDAKYRELVKTMLTKITTAQSQRRRSAHVLQSKNDLWKKSADLYIEAVKTICGITGIMTIVSEISDNLPVAAEKVKAFYIGPPSVHLVVAAMPSAH